VQISVHSSYAWLKFLRIGKVPQLSFKELVNNYSSAVMKTAIRILRDSQKAQDVHQEVFLAILRRWHKYNGRTNWGAYLYRVTVRKAMEIAKRLKAEQPVEQHIDCPATGDMPDGPLRTAELQQKLTACLAGFPKQQSDVFVLARIEGLTYRKIAEILECSQETVRVHLHRALKRLAHELGDYLA
jgi:RNA polymerase sigma-70 factor (ECF subfamily)